MSDFHMPNSYYDPPEYDGCEDCECEDPEYPQEKPCECGTAIYDCDDTTCGTVCECECHNLPSEPDPYDSWRDQQED